jgi:mannose-1-phosphate guanylyltransferase
MGDRLPKQFSPIVSAQSLLSETGGHLDLFFSGNRYAFVVACEPEGYYSDELADARDSLVIARPVNGGTAVRIIALVQIMQVNPDAMVGLFPCDHYYPDEETFRSIVRSATVRAERFRDSIVIVGAEAEYPETRYGWIEPAQLVGQSESTSLYRVDRFWEKPARWEVIQ